MKSFTDLTLAINNLYLYNVGLMWRPSGLYLKCDNPIFCDPYPRNVERFGTNIENVYTFKAYFRLKDI